MFASGFSINSCSFSVPCYFPNRTCAVFFFVYLIGFLRQFISKSCVMASVCVFDINACGKNRDNIAPKFMYVAHSMQLTYKHTHTRSLVRTTLILRSQHTFNDFIQCTMCIHLKCIFLEKIAPPPPPTTTTTAHSRFSIEH